MAKGPQNPKGHGRIEWDVPISTTFHGASEAIAEGADPFRTVYEAPFEPISTLALSRKLDIPVHDTHGRTDKEAFAATLKDLRILGIAPGQSSKPEEDQ